MRSILITGGGGLIGQAIAKRHLLAGDDVYIYDTRVNPYNDYSNLAGTDVSGITDISELLSQRKFDVISHQAAYVGVGESQYNIYKYVNNNVNFTASLLQTLERNKQLLPDRFLLGGSMGPYGEGPYGCDEHGLCYPSRKGVPTPTCTICDRALIPLAISEECLTNPKSIYGFTKNAQEQMVKVFAETYGMRTISLRYFSVYGLQSNPNNPFTGVRSIIANKILNNDVVKMYEDGSQTRDLICADDVAEAHLLACTMPQATLFEPYNIGTEVSTPLRVIAERMIAGIGPDKTLIFTDEYRSGDIKFSLSNCGKFRMRSGWSPSIGIDAAIEDYNKYISQHRERFTIAEDTCESQTKLLKERGIL